MADSLSPTIQRLRCLSKPRQVWPKGTRQTLTRQLAVRFCDLIATCDTSTAEMLAENPGLPPFKTLETWKYKFPWFHAMWKQARQRQAEHLMQICIREARNVTGKTAHAVRIKFDIYRFIAAKFHPDTYGDLQKPSQQQTTVNVGISIPQERLNDLRNKLQQTRTTFLPPTNGKTSQSTRKDESPVCSPQKA